jgi:hypothetical protein
LKSRIAGIRRANLNPQAIAALQDDGAAAHKFAGPERLAIEEANWGTRHLLPERVRLVRHLFGHRRGLQPRIDCTDIASSYAVRHDLVTLLRPCADFMKTKTRRCSSGAFFCRLNPCRRKASASVTAAFVRFRLRGGIFETFSTKSDMLDVNVIVHAMTH